MRSTTHLTNTHKHTRAHIRGHADDTRTVRDLDEVPGVDEQVARLHVAVDFSLRVEVVQAPQDVVGNLGQQLLVAGAALVDEVLLWF